MNDLHLVALDALMTQGFLPNPSECTGNPSFGDGSGYGDGFGDGEGWRDGGGFGDGLDYGFSYGDGADSGNS